MNVGFGRPSVTVNESDGEFMMCVLKDRETVFPVEVTISTSPGTATEGAGNIKLHCSSILYFCIKQLKKWEM